AREHAPLIRYLAHRLKRPVKLEILDGYVDIAQKLVTGDLEIGALAAYVYVRSARKHPGLKLLASHVTSSGKSYDGFIIARANSGIRTLKDLRGKVFCYVTHTSSSGYLYPRAEFRRHGLDPDTLFKSSLFAGDHLTALRMLYDGACDGAAVFTGMLYEAKKHQMPPERFKIILQTPRIPYDAYCTHQRVPKALRAALKKALLDLKPHSLPAQKVLGAHSRIKGFSIAKDSDYDSVRKIEHLLDINISSGKVRIPQKKTSDMRESKDARGTPKRPTATTRPRKGSSHETRTPSPPSRNH
ncbi:MAG: phosphate/phosphite/phosphonate ABC transporter substrate-binding protein, partial [Deltaproteobacteria bacterium]|nr:phosphate/phosphite/phosphonate ABC transporter substrate-binding protein [Deltaproteobacteria bacterium]